jgi:hypothetical protein
MRKPLTLSKIFLKIIEEGTNVTWNWGSGSVSGKVKSTFTKKGTRTIDGTER